MEKVHRTLRRRSNGTGVRKWSRYHFRLPPGSDREFEAAAEGAGYSDSQAAEFLVTSGLPLLRELASRGRPRPDETA